MPLPFVFPYSVVFWATWLWSFLPEFRIAHGARRRAAQPGACDAGSLHVINIGLGLGSVGAVALAWVQPLRVPAGLESLLFALGLAALIGGSLLRRHCWHVLGDYFTGEVSAKAGQLVIERGAYRWVRHPSYSAGTLMSVGFGLALGSYASAGLLAGVCMAVYSYRMRIEERVLSEGLGEPYRNYMRQRKRLIPFVY